MQLQHPLPLGVAVALSWLGLAVHNYLESVDGSTIAIGAISGILFLAWVLMDSSRVLIARLLLSLGLIQLVGAVITVMPLSFLPFAPVQSLQHYTVHVLYAACQLPLIVLAIKQSRHGSGSRALP